MLQRDPNKLFPHDHVMKYTLVPLVPPFVTPNMITLLRFFLIPAVLWFLVVVNYQIGVPLFLFAALTDALDGSVARLRHQVTEWGSFYDPLADKLLVGSVVMLVVAEHINVIFALLILFVEMLIVLGAIIRKKRGRLVSANVYGKTKMFFQILGLTLLLIALWVGFDLFIPLSTGSFSLAIVLAVISLFTYGI